MSTDTAALLALASRVEAGEVGREIDVEIATMFDVHGEPFGRYAFMGDDGRVHPEEPPRLTTSLDAIESLRQRELPGWQIRCGNRDANSFYAVLRKPDADNDPWGGYRAPISSTAPTLAQASLAALLRALAANKETPDADHG